MCLEQIEVEMIEKHVVCIDSIENHTFLSAPLQPGTVVVELGANDGFFAREIARRYPVTVHAVEANPELSRQLTGSGNVIFHHCAIAGEDGTIAIAISANDTASSVVSANVPAPQDTVMVPARRFETFKLEAGIGRIDLLKVDIEGAEDLLFASTTDPVLQAIPQITIEFHDDHGLITRQQFEAMRQRLERLGFHGIKFASNNTNWLFFQPPKVGVGRLKETYLRVFVRNVRGVARRLGFRSR